MVDKIYLQKVFMYLMFMYIGGECIGCDQQENFYRDIVGFMIEGIKQSIPIVVKGCLEVTLKSYWPVEEIADCIQQLSLDGFSVQAVISDNHSCNVSAFNKLKKLIASIF